MDEEYEDSIGYEFRRKIMISSVVILFVACLIIVLFHVYGRWFRRRRHHHLHLHLNTTSTVIIGSEGLDFSTVNSLPTFIYESKNQESPPECAVCLSEFEDNEAGRILPECNHCFHIDCIDMWLLSHCDCPLCRVRVKVQPVKNPVKPIENLGIMVSTVSINASENAISGSGYNSHPACQSDGIDMGCASSSSRSLDVPRESTIPRRQDPAQIEGAPDPNRNIGPDIESGSDTPANSVRVL